MRTFYYLFFLCLACIIPKISYSQNDTKDSLANYFEVFAYSSTDGRTPFWIQANQFGTVPRLSPGGSARIGVEQYWRLSQDKNPNWKAGFGIEAVGNYSETYKFILPQAHATIRYKNWEFFAGRKKQWVGLADSTLGMGSYAWSGNAMPNFRLQVGTKTFIPLPLTKGWISFSATYADGLMDKNRPITSDLKLHQKSLYLRLGKNNSKFKLYGGFNHQVQWGGKSPYWSDSTHRLPYGPKNYLSVVTGALGKTGTFFDSTSRIGNHLGTIDLGMEIETYNFSIFGYRQFIYEDGSLFYLQALKDGLSGIRLRRKNVYNSVFEITEGVFEFLFTKDQGGDDFVLTDGKKRGRDNYFNNQQIRDGWGYYDRTIGTPFIPPTSDTKWRWTAYADNFTSNNRVAVYHLGLKGTALETIEWTSKFSFSTNSGSYIVPFASTAKQFSGLIALQTRISFLGGSIIKMSLAADIGDLYPKSYGFSIGFKKDGILFIR